MHSALGIVLKKIDIGEDAVLLSIYTKEFGKLRAVAQGIKKEQAKLRGHLEPLNLVTVQYVSGKNGMRLTHAALEEYWDVLRNSWPAYSSACSIAALVDNVCFENDPDKALWLLLLESFATLNQEGFSEYAALQSSFEIRFAESLGYNIREYTRGIPL